MNIHMSEEEVMIGFMHQLRNGDEQAKQIHERFGQGDPKMFVQKAREFFMNKKGSVPENELELTHDVQFRSDSSNTATPSIVGGGDHNKATTPHKSVNEKSEVHVDEEGRYETLTKQPNAEAAVKSHADQITHGLEQMASRLSIDNANSNANAGDVQRYHSPQPPTIAIPGSILRRPPPGIAMVNYPPTPPSTPLRQDSSSIEPDHRTESRPPPGLPNFRQHQEHIPPSPAIPPTTPITKDPLSSVNANANTSMGAPATPNIPAASPAPPAVTPGKPAVTKWQPRRLKTRLQDQPGRILANNVPATLDGKPYLVRRPRAELMATWQLPLSFLRERTMQKIAKIKEEAMNNADVQSASALATPAPENLTIRDALRSLTVGLFRRGCAENGENFSIISKEIVPTDPTQKEFHFEINSQNGTIWGSVPFFTPR